MTFVLLIKSDKGLTSAQLDKIKADLEETLETTFSIPCIEHVGLDQIIELRGEEE